MRYWNVLFIVCVENLKHLRFVDFRFDVCKSTKLLFKWNKVQFVWRAFVETLNFFTCFFNNLAYITTKTAAIIIIFLYKRNKITHYKWLIALRLHNCNAKKHSWKIVTKNTSKYYIQSRVMQFWRKRENSVGHKISSSSCFSKDRFDLVYKWNSRSDKSLQRILQIVVLTRNWFEW